MRLIRIGQALRLRISAALIRVCLFLDILWAGETTIDVTNRSPLIRLLLLDIANTPAVRIKLSNHIRLETSAGPDRQP